MRRRLCIGSFGAAWSAATISCAAVLLATLSCSSADETVPLAPPPGPEEWNKVVTPPSDEDATAARAACEFKAGTLPAESQGASFPNGSDIPIDHIIVIMMENRSFDHYFQKLPEYGQPDVDVAPDDFTNPDADGVPVPIFHDKQYCFVDTNHGWNGTHAQLAGGDMSGFVVTNEGNHEQPMNGGLDLLSGSRAMGYYDETDLPFYYWLANTFSIADRYFCSLPGPTFPNRSYLYAATSFGAPGNSLLPADSTLIFDHLDQREVDWKVYAAGSPGFALFPVQYIQQLKAGRVVGSDDFFSDAAAGKLPSFAFVDPAVGLSTGQWDNNDEHPPAMAQIGERWVAQVLEAIMASPNWPRTAVFITYDEHGGLYDHVPPPSACKPDDLEPELAPGDAQGSFDQLGPRVPLIVVSPYAKKHHVGHEVYDHTSLLRFIEARFVMPALTARDANALAPWDMFDFENPAFLEPPTITIPEVPQDAFELCEELFGP